MGTSVDDSSALLLRLKFDFMRFVFHLEELFLRRVTSMFSAFGKAMSKKIISWVGGGGHCYSIVSTANDKAKFLE